MPVSLRDNIQKDFTHILYNNTTKSKNKVDCCNVVHLHCLFSPNVQMATKTIFTHNFY